jgi:hypothetical protein
MLERTFNAPIETVFGLMTNAKWIEKRCLDLGELSASVKVIKATKGSAVTTVSMQRRIRRDLPTLVAKVLNPETDMGIEETWSVADDGYAGSLILTLAGQPLLVNAKFSLRLSGKACVYTIQHAPKCSVPLIGGVVEKFALGQAESGYSDELDYLAEHLA